MSVFHRTRTRLVVCCAVATAALGVLVSVPAASAAGPPTYLALGDSLAYGFHQAQFYAEYPNVNPATFDEGYVDDFAADLKATDPSLQYINDGCPGETTSAFLNGSGPTGFIEYFCSNFPEETPFPTAWLHHVYHTSQLTDALSLIASNNVTVITLDIGSNDLLQFLQNNCGFPKEDKCTQAQVEGEAAVIIGNVASILGQLHAAAPHAQIIYLATYNPYPGIPPGADLLEAGLNAGLAEVASSIPKVSFANAEPVFNPSGTSGGPESGDIPTICQYTAMCPGGVFNPASKEADIHPTKLGYEVLAGLVNAAYLSHFSQELENWPVSGTLQIKKLGQSVALPKGSVFNGEAAVNLLTGSGKLSGAFTVPPFESTLKILGIPATVGLSVEQVGSAEGPIAPSTTVPGGVSVSLPTKANIGFSGITIFGLKIPLTCKTAEPVSLGLLDELTVSELDSSGLHFSGSTKVPSVKCEGALGALDGAILTSLFSGSNDPYTLAITPPA